MNYSLRVYGELYRPAVREPSQCGGDVLFINLNIFVKYINSQHLLFEPTTEQILDAIFLCVLFNYVRTLAGVGMITNEGESYHTWTIAINYEITTYKVNLSNRAISNVFSL